MSRNVRKSRETLVSELQSLVRAQQRAVDRLDQAVVDLFGLNRTDGRLVDLLQEHGPMPAGALARAAHLSTGAVTTAIDRLVERGLVERMEDPDDRRRVIVGLTDKTEHLVTEIYAPLATEGVERLSAFSVAELDAIVRYLELDRELHERHAEAIAARKPIASAKRRSRGGPS